MPSEIWQYLDFLGVAVFAATGGLVAARLRQDFIAFLFFCLLTGIGGGTLRDLLLNVPVFWTVNETYLYVCFVVSIAMWFFAHKVEAWGRPLRWLDAIGIAAYSVMGAAKALSLGDNVAVAVLMGVASATFGGILRDVIAGQPSALLQREIYLAAAFAGAITYTATLMTTGDSNLAAGLGFAMALILRGGAIARDWYLPSYAPPETKNADKLD
ncbi:membrane protein [Pseudovibrio japonicus]|uniref:Membrane protein n=1 Tax=Pseudovibrio japonicus TaxID=366534 RepID=A0ABQ3E3D9_9HYPH|nr:trimeric intracellular cation channel family protein [Pseudovibrio japonicus]GHB25042.1 membrane protein [Pseudovibrio japonicus]